MLVHLCVCLRFFRYTFPYVFFTAAVCFDVLRVYYLLFTHSNWMSYGYTYKHMRSRCVCVTKAFEIVWMKGFLCKNNEKCGLLLFSALAFGVHIFLYHPVFIYLFFRILHFIIFRVKRVCWCNASTNMKHAYLKRCVLVFWRVIIHFFDLQCISATFTIHMYAFIYLYSLECKS